MRIRAVTMWIAVAAVAFGGALALAAGFNGDETEQAG